MKKFSSSLVVLSFLVFLLSCSGSGPDKEPNNVIHEAAEVLFDEPFEIKIDPVGDIDWFKVEVPEQGYILVQANNVPKEIVLQVKYAMFQEWESEKEKKLKDWTATPAILHVPEAGTYYFAVADDWSDAASTNPISIKVGYVAEFDEFEFNDSHENAKPIETGQIFKVFIYPSGDTDWFMVKVDRRGYLKVMNRNTVNDINPEVKFIQINTESNEIKELTGWKSTPASCFIADSGNVYLLIHDDYDDKGANEPIEFKFDYLDNIDLTEPNGEFGMATEVKSGDTLNLAILPVGDNDFYKIEIGDVDKIKFFGKGWEDVIVPELKLYTLDTISNELKEYSEWKTLPVEFDVQADELYYIRIHDDWDDKSSEKPFKIIIE